MTPALPIRRRRGTLTTRCQLLPVLVILLVAPAAALGGGGRNRLAGSEATMQPVRDKILADGDLAEWDESQATSLLLNAMPLGDAPSVFSGYSAKIAFQYDSEALYAAVWWKDPTPLGPQTSPGCTPPGDGVILTVPVGQVMRVALWRVPGKTETRSAIAPGEGSLAEARPGMGLSQGYKLTGKTTYTQEARIPWSALAADSAPTPGRVLRIGVDLCFGGLDPTAGYRQFVRDLTGSIASGNRWGAGMAWGFMDGIASPANLQPTYDPYSGAEVRLVPTGTQAPPNPPVMYMGNEITRTTGMIATPVVRVTVDGRLDPGEWDTAGGTLIAYEPTLFPGRYATRVMWQYAEEGLYVGLRWHTAGPQFNVNDPARFDHGYDGGDALQIRLGTDRASHIDAWYFTEDKQPAISIVYGVRFNEGSLRDALAQGARLAVAPAEGGGYTEEIFLPWKLITKEGKSLKEGQSFRAVLDLFYSGLEGNRCPFVVAAKVASPSGVITLPSVASRDGFATVVIENERGEVLRRLLACGRVRQGQPIADWDGLDQEGKPLPPGKYRFRGLTHTGLGLKYLMSYNNPGNPPWQDQAGTGEWGGDHAPPQAVAADDWGVYLGWPAAEDGNGIIGCDFTGRKRWGFFQTPLPVCTGAACLASDGQYLYYAADTIHWPQKGQTEIAYFKTIVSCLDRVSGQRRGFSMAQPYSVIDEWDISQVQSGFWWERFPGKAFSLDNAGIHDDYFYTQRCSGANLTGLAARDGKLYVSLRLRNQIVVYNAADMKELERWNLPKPAGLAFSPDGKTVYAISDQSVVAIDPATGGSTSVKTTRLENPVGLAVHPDGKVLYVSQWGRAQCVQPISPRGDEFPPIGTPGGRPWLGAYRSDGMLQPRGIAVDKEGKLWVAEDDNFPRRVSVWNPRNGTLVKEFIGGTLYGGATGGMLDPSNPRRGISLGTLFDLDFAKGTYRPLTTMWRRTSLEQCMVVGTAAGQNATSGVRIVDYKGKRFLLTTGNMLEIALAELRPDGTAIPRAAVGGILNRGDNPLVMPKEKRGYRHGVWPEFMYGHGGDNFVWTDNNGDGVPQAEEMQWRKQTPEFPYLALYWGSGTVDQDLNVYIGGAYGTAALVRFPLQGLTASGAPRYDLNTVEVLAVPPANEPISALARDAQGNLFTVHGGEWRTPTFHPALKCYGPDGKLRWSYETNKDYKPMGNITGEAIMGPLPAPGGEAGEILALQQYHGCYVPFLTTDGLFIGRVLRDPAEGGPPGPDVYRSEVLQYLNRLPDGRLVLSHGKNAHHLMQVTGLETVKRFAGEFTLTTAQAALAVQRLQAAAAEKTATAPIRIAWRQTPPVVDGSLEDWDLSTAASIGPAEGVPRAQVMLAADQKTDRFYLAFRVYKHGQFRNTGQDPTQLFLTGDCVDLQFCTDVTADPQRLAPAMGDQRLIISKVGERPVAVLYKALVPFAKNPVAFRSPVREVVFDEVVEIRDAEVKIADTEEGYIVEAGLRYRDLFKSFLWWGEVLQGDAGIIVADQTGRRVARIYRFNQDTGLVADVPTEAALTPSKWGEIEVDKQ